MGKGFDLSSVLRDVSNPDTGRDKIEYIRLSLLDEDPNNFYQLSGIQELADNIAAVGLQQPLRVRPNPDREGRYMIVSGHRRHAAILELVTESPGLFDEIPCIVDRAQESDTLHQLRLIYANANTRTMTSAEISEQAAQVEKLLYQLKEEGFDFPGRMRDHVAEACQVSKTKLARLRVIKNNLAKCWGPAWKKNKLKEATAYALAQMPEAWQECIFQYHGQSQDLKYFYEDDVQRYKKQFQAIEKIRCPDTMAKCEHLDAMRNRMASRGTTSYTAPCTSCCIDCPELKSCKFSCREADQQKAKLKAEARAQKQDEKRAQEESDRPAIEYIQGVYQRVGERRKKQGVTVRELYGAAKMFWGKSDDEKQDALERCHCAFSPNTILPFGYSFHYSSAQNLCAIADLLGCSIDYLLGREEKTESVSESDTWQTGKPEKEGDYVGIVRYSSECSTTVAELHWNGCGWEEYGELLYEGTQVLRWTSMPDTEVGCNDEKEK